MSEPQLTQAVLQTLQQSIAASVVQKALGHAGSERIPVGVSARHVHLAAEHVEILFGQGYELTAIRDLQPGQFACKETVTLVGRKQALHNVRVLGPARDKSQVELAVTDCYALGVEPVLRASGDVAGSPGIALVGPRGAFYLAQGVIVAWRHIHMTPEQAAGFGLRDKDLTCVKVAGERALIFDQVLVRVSSTYSLELHLDTDEANAAGLKSGDGVQLI